MNYFAAVTYPLFKFDPVNKNIPLSLKLWQSIRLQFAGVLRFMASVILHLSNSPTKSPSSHSYNLKSLVCVIHEMISLS